MEWPSCLDEYEKLVNRMNTPRVVIDNGVCSKATLVKVDSGRKHGILLEAVQVLTDLDLSINKAYISSDGRWSMDVFHVTDGQGRKLTDDRLVASIEQSLSAGVGYTCHCHPSASDLDVLDGLTALELTGSDRPGLLSEVFAVLSDLYCSVVDAKVWTHSGRIASLIFVRDDESGSPDSRKIRLVESRLRNLLKGDDDVRGATTTVSFTSIAHADRRLHQMMLADRDYERRVSSGDACSVSVQNWVERGYSAVSVRSPDRPKLLFDVICTLTDMKYVVFHGTVDTSAERAHLELYIRHTDGSPISSDAEMQRVIQCLEAAIERRGSEGVKLELCALDRRGLLAEVTRTFRENGLSVTRAEVSTKDGAAANVFYVTDAAGHAAEPKAIAAVIERVGPQYLKVAQQRPAAQKRAANAPAGGGVGMFSLGSLVMRNLYNLGLVRSCS